MKNNNYIDKIDKKQRGYQDESKRQDYKEYQVRSLPTKNENVKTTEIS